MHSGSSYSVLNFTFGGFFLVLLPTFVFKHVFVMTVGGNVFRDHLAIGTKELARRPPPSNGGGGGGGGLCAKGQTETVNRELSPPRILVV